MLEFYCEVKNLLEIDTLVFSWIENCEPIDDSIYKACLRLLYENVRKYRPSKMIFNYSTLDFTPTRELELWTQTLFAEIIKLGVQTICLNCPTNTKNIHFEYLLTSDLRSDVEVKKFHLIQECLNWILNPKQVNSRNSQKIMLY